jgi:hypothetical protein
MLGGSELCSGGMVEVIRKKFRKLRFVKGYSLEEGC